MTDFNYFVKVYADAVELDFRSLDSIPLDYRDAVGKELSNRNYKRKEVCNGLGKGVLT